jgi:hypothetical protein
MQYMFCGTDFCDTCIAQSPAGMTVRFGSKGEQLNLSVSHPRCPQEQTTGQVSGDFVYQYEAVPDRVLWNVVVDELPRLKLAVEALAAAPPE